MRNIKICIAAAALVAGANVAHAESGSVEFNGTAMGACSFSNAQPGSIEVDGTLKKWTTKTAATIDLTQTGGAESRVVLTLPLGWKSSPAMSPSTTFSLNPSIMTGPNSGAVFSQSNPETYLPNPGVDTINVEMTAESASPFTAGAYVAEVTLTCSTAP